MHGLKQQARFREKQKATFVPAWQGFDRRYAAPHSFHLMQAQIVLMLKLCKVQLMDHRRRYQAEMIS
jgi:hypothetical protein